MSENPTGGKKRGGRPSLLTPERTKLMVDALKAGNFFETACKLAGISSTTGYNWMEKGSGDNAKKAVNALYVEFRDAVKRAESEAEVASVARIRKAAIGGQVLERTTVTVEHPDGRVETKTTERFGSAQWTADAWFLERKFAERWGRKEASKLGGDGSPENDPLERLVQAIEFSRKKRGR